MAKEQDRSLLEIKDLSISFCMYKKGMVQKNMEVIHGLNLSVKAGEVLAVVGASGSGKSLLAHAILGLLPDNACSHGTINYQGKLLSEARIRALRGKEIRFIPQSVDYLDPLMPVGKQVRGIKGSIQYQRETFRRYGLDQKVEKQYPYQLSGGMARRVLIAMAVMEKGQLIIADEPTPGLDRKTAEETMGHFKELAAEGCGVLLITHDLDLALKGADRIAVLYAGTAVEVTSADNFKAESLLQHPYSKALYQAMPQNGFQPIPGIQPHPEELPRGCAFAPRCPYRTRDCKKKVDLRRLKESEVRCIHAT